MEINKESITITDEVIVSYYRENTNIDIVTMNHIFIDILKNLSSNLSSTINTTINSKILSIVSEIDKNISLMKSDILLKFHESKKEYIEDVKNILFNNTLSNNEKISAGIEKSNELLLSKMTLLINEVVPKSQESTYLQIEGCIKGVFSTITQDTSKLLEITNKIDVSSKDDSLVKTFVDNIDTHLTKMLSTIQQPIFNSIQLSEERTNTGIQQIKDNFIVHQNIQETLRNEMQEFLSKYKNNPQFKGSVAEVELQHMLLSIMPSDEIIKVTHDTATCDFRVNRKDKNKPNILFESKNYKSRSTTTEEVKKFERDLQLQKIHGILVSQESPITFKDNFQIDIINGLIHVYIPNANYEIEKVKIAIDIIDNLSLKLDALSKHSDENDYTISKEDVEELAEDFRLFAIQKSQMLDTIRLVNKQLTDKLEEIQLPKLKKFLMKLGNIENDNNFKCTFCNEWNGKNKASLGAHMRNCKFNPKNKEFDSSNILISNEIILNEEPLNAIIEDVNITIEQPLVESSIKKQKSKISKTTK
jgi:hypothetical protein